MSANSRRYRARPERCPPSDWSEQDQQWLDDLQSELEWIDYDSANEWACEDIGEPYYPELQEIDT